MNGHMKPSEVVESAWLRDKVETIFELDRQAFRLGVRDAVHSAVQAVLLEVNFT